ncbi:MAG: PIG-L family deacetylase [Acidobacteriaceae bacterium]|nr:PIG-L family deacetylase [Acidobacteriaceae bacterium]MBV9498118.1 PIG-L family deacetylase [Acidobacteriaceae bacterium]
MASALRLPTFEPRPVSPGIGQTFAGASTNRSLNVICVGAHPDDPETGCGGTLAKFIAEGHNVTIVYLTRGEAGLRTAGSETASRLRTAEALRACELLGATAVFANQIDGQTSTERERVQQFTALLESLDPDIAFTHWPLDTHRDHRNTAQLTYEAWQALGESFALVYYEVMTGVQTHHFEPNCFIDVSSTSPQKRSAVYAHVCQNPDRFYPYHEEMERERGSQAHLPRAEAFVVVRERLPKPFLPFEM